MYELAGHAYVIVEPGSPYLWGNLVRADSSSALRDMNGKPTPVLCIRVHGVPDHNAIAQVRGPETRKTVKFNLGSNGVASRDVVLKRPGVFTIDVKGDDQPDFLQFTARVPSPQLAARSFSCS